MLRIVTTRELIALGDRMRAHAYGMTLASSRFTRCPPRSGRAGGAAAAPATDWAR